MPPPGTNTQAPGLVSGQTPTAQPGLVSGQTPTAQPGLVSGQTPTAQPGFVSGQTPTAQPGLVSGQTPTAQPGLVSGKIPTAQPDLVSGQTPTAQPGLVSGQTPTAQPGLVSGQTPTAQPGLVSGQTPTAQPGLVSGQSPTAQPGLVSGQTPTAQPSLVSGWTPTKKPQDGAGKTTVVVIGSTPLPYTCKNGWSDFMNVDSPGVAKSWEDAGPGDYESIKELRNYYSFCANPIGIKCQTAADHQPYQNNIFDVGVTCDLSYGLKCLNSAQGGFDCSDYEVSVNCDCGRKLLFLFLLMENNYFVYSLLITVNNNKVDVANILENN